MMRPSVKFLLAPGERPKLLRLAACTGAIALVYFIGPFNLPHAWMFYPYKATLMNISYSVIGASLLLHAASSMTLSWAIIPFAAAAGYLGGVVSQIIVIVAFEHERWFPFYTRHPGQGVLSVLGVSVFFGAWLGGAIAGALILILDRGLSAIVRWRT